MEYTSHVVQLEVWNTTLVEVSGIENHRPIEVERTSFRTEECYSGDWDNCFITMALFDTKWAFQMNALLNISKTFFIILVLGLGALFFSRDANQLVLRPLERMIKTVSFHPVSGISVFLG